MRLERFYSTGREAVEVIECRAGRQVENSTISKAAPLLTSQSVDKSHGPLLQEVGKRVRRQPPSFLFGVFREKEREKFEFFYLNFFFF